MSELKVASKLSDVKETFHWYSMQFPELEKLEPRVGHSLISLERGKVLMIGGGNHGGSLSDVLSINLEPIDCDSERVAKHPASKSFPARYEFSCSKDKVGQVWIFGGSDTSSTTNQVIRITDDGEVKVLKLGSDSEGPCARTQGSNSALVESQGKEFIAVFAGGLKLEQPVADKDLYLFSLEDQTWQKITVEEKKEDEPPHPFVSQPPAVQGHVMTAVGSKILLHGGMNNVTLYDGFHWMDLSKENDDGSRTWLESSVSMSRDKPSARAAHGTAKISDVEKDSQILYIFGGLGEKGTYNDLWSFNADSMSWKQVMKNHSAESYGHYPVPRLDFGMCSVGLKDANGVLSTYLMIHGGMNSQGELFNDSWVMKIS